ncbi:hypothetical protein FWG95_03050 [Candidatus Saccharibacteria bacterium]|nr:hypothetical protein [Candidatus Saccharibacteria bacterium]
MKRCVGAAAYNICHGANAPHAPMPMNPWKLKQGTDAEAEQLKAISERQEDLSDREVDIQRHVEDVDQRSKESNLSLADKFKQWIQFPRMAMTNRIKLAQELQEAGATVTIAASRDDAYFPLTDEEIAKAAELQIPLIEMAGAHSELAWRPVAYIKEFLRLRGQKLHPDK